MQRSPFARSPTPSIRSIAKPRPLVYWPCCVISHRPSTTSNAFVVTKMAPKVAIFSVARLLVFLVENHQENTADDQREKIIQTRENQTVVPVGCISRLDDLKDFKSRVTETHVANHSHDLFDHVNRRRIKSHLKLSVRCKHPEDPGCYLKFALRLPSKRFQP